MTSWMKLRASTYGFRRWIDRCRIGTFSSRVSWPVIRQMQSTVRRYSPCDPVEDPRRQRLVLDQIGVEAGDRQVGLGQDHLDVIDQRCQKGQRRYISCRWPSSPPCSTQVFGDGAAQAVPAGQRMPALHPAEDQGDGAEVLDPRGRRSALGREPILSWRSPRSAWPARNK